MITGKKNSYFVVVVFNEQLKGPWKFRASGLIRNFDYRPERVLVGSTSTGSFKKGLLDLGVTPSSVKPFYAIKNINKKLAEEVRLKWLQDLQIIWIAELIHQFCCNGHYIRSYSINSLKEVKALMKVYPDLHEALSPLGTITAHNFFWNMDRGVKIPTKLKSLNKVFIPYNVASSKNSKQWTGKMLISSSAARKYYKASKSYWELNRDKFKSLLKGHKKPYLIGFHFVRNSKRSYDFTGPLETAQDQMVRFGWIEDDSIHDFYPMPYEIDGEYTTYNDTGGVFISVIKKKAR